MSGEEQNKMVTHSSAQYCGYSCLNLGIILLFNTFILDSNIKRDGDEEIFNRMAQKFGL